MAPVETAMGAGSAHWVDYPRGRPPWGKQFLTVRAEATSLPSSVALYFCRPGPAGHNPSGGREKVLDPHGSAKEEEREVREVWGWCGGLAGLLTSSATP